MFHTLYLILLLPKTIQAQDYGKVWVQGAGISFTTTFTGNGPVNNYFDTLFSPFFAHGNSNICDSAGNLLLCSDGYNVYNNIPAIVDNGDILVPHSFYFNQDGWSSLSQSSIFLPIGNNNYYFITPAMNDSIFDAGAAYFDMLLYNVIDMNANGGAGKIVKRMIPILDRVQLGGTRMIACKHGDGKSWWLLKQAKDTNIVYKFLFTKDSVFGPYVQIFSGSVFGHIDHSGQSMFSQDGLIYAATNRNAYKVFISDFDRCTGELSNPRVYDVPPLSAHFPNDTTIMDSTTQGLCFSPNGRFLYVSHFMNIHQLDLQDMNPDTRWSVIAGLDTTFAAFQMYASIYPGPDGKLYIGNWNGLCAQMSVINNPDNKGAACNFCPKCLRFPEFYFSPTLIGAGVSSPPCMPNYKLGPTNPICWPLEVKEITREETLFKIYPNPNTGKFTVRYRLNEAEQGILVITDIYGRQVKKIALVNRESQSVDLNAEPSGIYFYSYFMNGILQNSGKISVIK